MQSATDTSASEPSKGRGDDDAPDASASTSTGALGEQDRRVMFSRHFNSSGQLRINLAERVSLDEGFEKVSFHLDRFLYQLFIHMFAPLTLPIVYLRDGKVFYGNQEWAHPVKLIIGLIPNLMCWSVLLAYALDYDALSEDIPPIEALMPFLLFTVHRLMIATKYAYTRTSDYRRMHYEPVDIGRFELVRGWSTLDEEQCATQVYAAARRLGVVAHKLTFHTASSLEEIRSFLQSSTYDAMPSNRSQNLRLVCVQSVISRIALMADKHQSEYMLLHNPFAVYLPSIAVSLIFPLERAIRGDDFFGSPSRGLAVFVVIVAIMGTFFFFAILVRFLDVGVTDYRRRFLMLKLINGLVDPALHARNRARKRGVTQEIERLRSGADGRAHEERDDRAEVDEEAGQRSGVDRVASYDDADEDDEDDDVIGQVKHAGDSGDAGQIDQRLSPLRAKLDQLRSQLPTIELIVNENVLTWLVARQITQTFGLSFRRRVNLYSSYAFLVVLALVVFLFVQLFRDGITVGMVVMAMVVSISIGYFLVQLAYYGNTANHHLDNSSALVTRVQFAVRELLTETRGVPFMSRLVSDKIDAKQLNECDLLLDSALKYLDVERRYGSLSLLGLQGGRLMVSILTLVVAAISFGVRLVQ